LRAAGCALLLGALAGDTPSSIRFALKPIAFQLESGEAAPRHVPAAMGGGVAVFDYNHDGRPKHARTEAQSGSESLPIQRTSLCGNVTAGGAPRAANRAIRNR
jgi:hypothetical protein